MASYLVRRLLFAIVTLLAVLTLVFLILRVLPGDPAMVILGDQASAAGIAALHAKLGLDRPLAVQYASFVAGAVVGDWGNSMVTGRPVIAEIGAVLPYTIELTAVATVLGLVLGVPGGVWAATNRNRFPDYLTRIVSLLGLSAPAFVSGIVMLLLFAIHWQIFPVISAGQDPSLGGRLRDLALPALNLALIMAAYITRVTRSSMLEVLGQDYVRTARAKGVPPRPVVWRHTLRNALIPIVTVTGLYIGILIGNSVLTEIVFNRPGLGKLIVGALAQRDYTMLQGMMVIYTGIIVVVNLATDLTYGMIDPRVQYPMTALVGAEARAVLRLAWNGLRAAFARPEALVGGVLVVLIVVLAVAAPLIAPYDPVDQDIVARLQGPSAAHWLGTDEFGRDTLSRLLYGARPSLIIGVVAVLGAGLVGTIIGLISGYFGGAFDVVAMQVMDILLAFPALILGLMLVAVLGPSMFNLIVAIAVTAVPPFARIARAPVIAMRERDFIAATRALGFSPLRIMGRHILPGILPDLMVMTSLWIATAIRTEASLAFIGLGLKPPIPSWGGMIRDGFENILDAPSLALFPSLAVLVVVLSLNLLGDGLRDAIDPALRTGIMTAPLLRVQDLKVGFGGRMAVDGVSFEIGAGEVAALVGESGSGKSVSALAAMRLLPAAATVSGRVTLDGLDILALPEAQMRPLRGSLAGMIFQEPLTSLNPVLTVGFQIVETLRYHGRATGAAAMAEAKRLLDLVRIPDAATRLHDHPHSFSGGMRQRIMIAMALACRPKLLIADEPTTALDVTIQAGILDLLRDLRAATGTAILFITHDMGVVAEIADRVVVMRQGKVLENRDVAGIFADPRAAYTKVLLAAVPALGARPPLPPPPPAAPLLVVEDLVTRFPVRRGVFGRPRAYVHAVESTSFKLDAGETLALVGESGCGKSTTGRSIIRLAEPQSGRVRFSGEDVLQHPPAALRQLRRQVQMIFQDPFGSLDPRQTVRSAIAEPIRVHGIAAGREVLDRVAYLMGRVGLDPGLGHRFPHEFSGGQRQRICIARALGLAPKLVIADEAVSALDVSTKAQVIELLMDLQAEFGLSYLFISHDLAAVERISHRVAVMYQGEIVEIGPREAVIGAPAHAYTRRLLAAVPVVDPARRRARLEQSADLPSPIRPAGYTAPRRRYRDLGDGHLVQEEAITG